MSSKKDDDKNYKPYAFKLDKNEDADLIEYLDGAPITYIIKKALRLYKRVEEDVESRIVAGVGSAGSHIPAPAPQAPQAEYYEESRPRVADKVEEDEIPF